MVNPYTIMHTADGGQTFEKQTSPATDIKLNGVCFGTDLKGIAVGINTIIYTSDGGANWAESPDAGYTNWLSVFLTETGKAWVVGNNGSIAYSIDWGHTWEAQESGVTDPLWEVYFINDNEGWIVGGFEETNTILHTKNGGVISTGINDLNDHNFKIYNLEQNYPNPFNSSTQICYTLNQSSHITLTVYDLLGRKIQTLVNEFQTTGNHTVNFEASHLCNGVYFYQLKLDNNIMELKKMMVN